MNDRLTILQGDVRACCRRIQRKSVQMCVTSPPYWGLRSYSTEPQAWGGSPEHIHEWVKEERGKRSDMKPREESSSVGRDGSDEQQGFGPPSGGWFCSCGSWLGELGQEPTPQLFVAHLVEVFAEVWEVLRNDGTLWINMGDSYNANGRKGHGDVGPKQRTNRASADGQDETRPNAPGLKAKDRVMMPARMAMALQEWGWYLRDEIVWLKPNPMPMSMKDRCSPAHEMVYMLTKKPRYFYDQQAIAEPAVTAGSKPGGKKAASAAADIAAGRKPGEGNRHMSLQEAPVAETRNKRSVWKIATHPYKAAHFATFPPKLITPMIRAGTSEAGCCGTCGAPMVRQVERVKTFQSGSGRSGNQIFGKQDLSASETNSTPDVRRGPCVSVRTVGWQPSCACPPAEVVPSTVLDIFGGSFTTAVVALEHGRSAIVCELQPDYVALGRQRIRQAIGELFLPEVPQPIICGSELTPSNGCVSSEGPSEHATKE